MTMAAKIEKIFSGAGNPQNSRWKNWLDARVDRGKREVFTENVEIGPALAELILELNTDNRPVSDMTVKVYARQMREGKWGLTGESIIISKSGRCINGQHRLFACQQAGAIFRALIVFGVEDEVQPLLDTGKKRTAGDVFALKGVSNSIQLAAAISWVMQIENGQQMRGAAARPSNEELYEQYLRHPRVGESARVVAKPKGAKLAPLGLLIAAHYLCACRDEKKADRFFEQLLTGANLAPDEPAYILRQRLIDNLNSKAKLSPWYIAALLLKAWNKVRKNERLKTLRWSMDEEFPVVE